MYYIFLQHFAYHNINMYQCIFCLFGTEVMDLMINHLSMEHFEYEPLCLERSPKSDICVCIPIIYLLFLSCGYLCLLK